MKHLAPLKMLLELRSIFTVYFMESGRQPRAGSQLRGDHLCLMLWPSAAEALSCWSKSHTSPPPHPQALVEFCSLKVRLSSLEFCLPRWSREVHKQPAHSCTVLSQQQSSPPATMVPLTLKGTVRGLRNIDGAIRDPLGLVCWELTNSSVKGGGRQWVFPTIASMSDQFYHN